MEIPMMSPSPIGPNDQTDAASRPADDVPAPVDGGFNLLLAMALQAAPLAVPTAALPQPSGKETDPGSETSVVPAVAANDVQAQPAASMATDVEAGQVAPVI